MKIFSIRTFILVGFLLSFNVYSAPVFQLDPIGGTIYGMPGATIGWGFSLSNNSDYLLVSGAEFVPQSTFGTFTDYIAQYNSVVVGPSPENNIVIQPFDSVQHSGIGSFFIDPSTVFGTNISGSIILTYDLFSLTPNDPNFNPDINTISTGNLLQSSASVIVQSSVPIPASIWLFGAAMPGFLAFIKRRKIS